jgi:apolipoprotein N-acyltransferase
MNTDITPSKPKTIHKVINVFLLIYNSSIAFGVFSTYSFEDLQFYKKIILIVPALFLTAFMIIKEFKVQPLIKRVYLNLFIFMGFLLIGFCWYSIW